MKSSIRALLFITSILFLQEIANAQSHKFKIMNGDDHLGFIHANMVTQGNKETYRVTSKASFRVILKYVRETFMDVVFVNDLLTSSVMKQTMNGDLKAHKVTKKNGSYYDCSNNEDEKFKINKPITFCSCMLFFKEPKGQQYVFAESHQTLSPITKIGESTYKLTLPGGKINHYIYKNGALEEVRVFRTITNLVFKRAY